MSILRRRTRLGYALGSGSAKGLAHIGVLKVLEGADIRPSVIAGSSIGAIVGALSASGQTAQQIEHMATKLDLRELMTLADLRAAGPALISGDSVERFLRANLPANFEDLVIPFACVSSDLRSGKRVVHTRGDLVSAIRASLSIPVIFSPVELDGRLLIDGGVTEPVPVDTARELGAKRIVAVTLYSGGGGFEIESGDGGTLLEKLLARSERAHIALASVDLMQARIAEDSLERADIVIRPDINKYSQLSWMNAEELIARGEAAAREQLDAIRALKS